MRIVHFAISPMAGAPLRLVRALRGIGLDARLIDLDRYDLFGHDMVFREHPDEALALAEAADVIHLHNYLTCASREFFPIDFAALRSKGKAFIRHFHSTPELIAGRTATPVHDILADPMPQLVIAQFHERYYPRAMVLPNLVPQEDPDYLPWNGPPDQDVFFGPTNLAGAGDDRWNTKGAPETRLLMEQAASTAGCSFRLMTGRPLAEVLRAKRRSRIVLDEMVTGSYHLSGLEGLAMGKPVLAFLDPRTTAVLQEFSGTSQCPFVNVRLEDALPVLLHLLRDPAEAAAIGQAARAFMETRWNAGRIAHLYEDMYRLLLEHPDRVTRQPALALDSPARRFHAVTLPDLVHQCRFPARA